jgi:uncharacterized protein (TIGR03437 family)
VSTSNPAHPGEVVIFYGTGLGTSIPALATGQAASGNLTVTPVAVTIDGVNAEVTFSGAAPGFVGLNQINVRIPQGTRIAVVPVVLSVGGTQSNIIMIPIAP